jgi:cytochrome c-type biogenesis protein CcmH
MGVARRSRVGWLVLVAALLASGVGLVVVAARGSGPPRTLAEQVREVASSLRCPVCQNLSVADSSSRLASEMRAGIARDLQAGRSPAEIRQEFVAAYGEWILLSPPRRGINWMPWLAPAVLLIGGMAAAFAVTRRWAAGSPVSTAKDPG